MIPAERRQRILSLLRESEVISINALVEDLDVSHMTIRCDLQKMEEEGLVIQVSGGVQSAKRITDEPSHQIKTSLSSEENDRIGQLAASLIPNNTCIYLDAGTTSYAMCKYLANRSDLTIVSNDFAVMDYLMNHSEANLIHTGGLIRKQNYSAVGHLASDTISKLSIDFAFLSASSWDNRGITTPDMDKVVVKRAVAKACNKKILICDSTKYAKFATYVAIPLEDLDIIVSDSKLCDEAKKLASKSKVELMLA